MTILSVKTNEDFVNIFNICKDYAKFIDEYIELLEYIDNKYPNFKDDINKDWWIKRIIKDHFRILVSLSDYLPEEDKFHFNEYLERMKKRLFVKFLCSD